MDDFTFETIKGVIKDPTALSVLISSITLAGSWWFKKRDVEIVEKTSLSAIQSQQIELLMQQITQLSNELGEARTQLTELHNQNVELMERIRELESIINMRKTARPAEKSTDNEEPKHFKESKFKNSKLSLKVIE